MKTENMNIRITKESKKVLELLGGQTKGFDFLVDFFLENCELKIIKAKSAKRKKALTVIKKGE